RTRRCSRPGRSGTAGRSTTAGRPAAAASQVTTTRSCGSGCPASCTAWSSTPRSSAATTPPQVSVEALRAEGYPSRDELAAMTWHTLVARTDARGDAVNIYPVAGRRTRWTHVRLSIYPDGGVARFRVHGTAVPDPWFRAGTIDLAAAEHGGRVTGCSDAFYSSFGGLHRARGDRGAAARGQRLRHPLVADHVHD